MLSSCAFRAAAVLVLLGAGTLAAGCIPPPFHLSDDAPQSSSFERVLLLPANFEGSPRPGLSAGAEIMGERLRHYLEARGLAVETMRMSTTLALWKESTEAVGGISTETGELDEARYELARSELARRALESISADGVIMASVLVRQGRYMGQALHWDGVTRPLVLDRGSHTHIVQFLRGKGLATSLRASVFDTKGVLIFERYAGLETMRRFSLTSSNAPSRVDAKFRTDLFQNEEFLTEGVSLSLQPWLAPLPEEP